MLALQLVIGIGIALLFPLLIYTGVAAVNASHFPFAVQTTPSCDSTLPRRESARVDPEIALENERAQGKPGARCTRSLARKQKSARASSPQVHRNSPAFPAQWFYGL